MESRVLDGLRDILVDNDALIEEFRTELNAELGRLKKQQQSGLRDSAKELADIERGIARLISFITSGNDAPESVRSELIKLEDRKAHLLAQQERMAISPVVGFHPNYADLYHRKVNKLGELLSSEDSREEGVAAIRSRVDRIELRAGAKRGETEVTLVGALAGILALGANENAAFEGGGTFLLVAGVGFEPTTFRL